MRGSTTMTTTTRTKTRTRTKRAGACLRLAAGFAIGACAAGAEPEPGAPAGPQPAADAAPAPAPRAEADAAPPPALPDAAPPPQGPPDAAGQVDRPPVVDRPPQARADASPPPGSGRDGGAPGALPDPCPPRGTPCRVLPLGDSITEGFNDPILGGYRTWIWQSATAEGKALDFVGSNNSKTKNRGRDNPLLPDQDNEGWQGATIVGLHDAVPRYLADAKPHVVLLMIGTNDVTWKQRGVSDAQRAEAPARLARLVDRIGALAPEALLVVGQIVPPKVPGNWVDADSDARVRAYNAALVELVARRAAAGARVVSVDLYGGMDPASDMADGLHPNVSGFKKMAARFYEVLGRVLK